MFFLSRFFYREDVVHRLFEVVTLVAMATAVLHIRSVPIMSHPEKDVDMFAYCLSIAVSAVLGWLRSVEVILCQRRGCRGLHPEAVKVAQRDLIWTGIPICFFITATIYQGIQTYGNDESTSSKPHRLLAETIGLKTYPDSLSEDDIAVWVMLAGSISMQLALGIMLLFWSSMIRRKDFDFKA